MTIFERIWSQIYGQISPKNRSNMVKLSLFLHISLLHFFSLMAQPLFILSNLGYSPFSLAPQLTRKNTAMVTVCFLKSQPQTPLFCHNMATTTMGRHIKLKEGKWGNLRLNPSSPPLAHSLASAGSEYYYSEEPMSVQEVA